MPSWGSQRPVETPTDTPPRPPKTHMPCLESTTAVCSERPTGTLPAAFTEVQDRACAGISKTESLRTNLHKTLIAVPFVFHAFELFLTHGHGLHARTRPAYPANGHHSLHPKMTPVRTESSNSRDVQMSFVGKIQST